MKKCLISWAMVGFAMLVSQQAFAIVTGDAALSFTFGQDPDEATYNNYLDNYYGDLGYQIPPSLSNIIQVYLNSSYVGNDTYHGNSASAIWGGKDPSSFSLTAQCPAPGGSGFGDADLYSGFAWFGTNFPGFTYHYNYNGAGDSANDTLWFGTTMEITSGDSIYYTDYEPTDPTYRTKYYPFQAANGVINISGDVVFDPINFNDSVLREWDVRWELMGLAWDEDFPSPPVPEPATMLLFGLGGAGMAFLRRHKVAKRGVR